MHISFIRIAIMSDNNLQLRYGKKISEETSNKEISSIIIETTKL